MGRQMTLTVSKRAPDYPNPISYSDNPGFKRVQALLNPDNLRETEVDIDLIDEAIESMMDDGVESQEDRDALRTIQTIKEAAGKYGGYITLNVG